MAVVPTATQAADSPATRAEVIRAIVLAQTPNIPAIRNIGQFKDVPSGHPDEAMLLYAERQSIIRANEYGYLLPYNTVSRAELTVMLARAYNVQSLNKSQFDDVDQNSWYAPFAGIAASYHLFTLSDPRRLEPAKTVTMEEVNRALLLVETYKAHDAGPIRIDTPAPLHPAANPPSVYTVVAIRKQKVALIDAPVEKRFPLVLRTALVQPLTLEEKRATIFTMVNAIRLKNGLVPFIQNDQLQQSAQAYADRMANEGFFAHISPEGGTVQQRIDATGFTNKSFLESCRCVPGYALAENLARGQKTAEEAVKDWMNSPEHRAAILNPAYTHTGIGLNAGIWVEHFGGVVLP